METMKTARRRGKPQAPFQSRLSKWLHDNSLLLLMFLPGLFILAIFKIGPLLGMSIAFQDYSAFKGVMGSTFVGLKHFQAILKDEYMVTLVKNTVLLAFFSLLVSFPFPIIFSVMLNEVRLKWVRRPVQSLSFLPYFISSAVMVSIAYTLLSPTGGLVNQILNYFGKESIFFMAEPGWFRPIYIILQVWQTFGYSAIVYIAAMTAIDPALYESANIDGATRWQKIKNITLPSISGIIVVMLIISVGNIFTVDLDRILLMYNQSVYKTADVIQTYVYRIGFETTGFPNYSYGTAVNLIKSIIAFILVVATNKVANKYSETRLF